MSRVGGLAARLAAASSAGVIATVPALASASTPSPPGALPRLSARAAALIDESTGSQLFALNGAKELPIASTTKLMTALVTLERVKRLSTTFAQTDYRPAAVDSQIGLVPGERMSVHDLLLALLLPSADDAAVDLAYNVGGRSISRFVAMMNVRARQLGLLHTHYSTPVGLDTPGNHSSASDLVELARFMLTHHPFFARAVELPRAVLSTGDRARVVTNTNDLVGRVRWINGVKTGHTADAGYVLVGSGTRSGMALVSAVLGASSESARDANTVTLLDWGFAHFRQARLIVAGSVLARVPVRGQSNDRIPVIAARTVIEAIPKGSRVQVRLELPRQLSGPRVSHAVIGTAFVVVGASTLVRVPLLLERPIAAPPTSATMLITRLLTLVLLFLLLAGAAGLIVRRRERARRSNTAGAETA